MEWSFRSDRRWELADTISSHQVEKSYFCGQTSLKAKIGKYFYAFDLTKKTLCNQVTGTLGDRR
jgi:hypothetical protein